MIEVVGFVEVVGGGAGEGLGRATGNAARISCGDMSSAGRAAGDHTTCAAGGIQQEVTDPTVCSGLRE